MDRQTWASLWDCLFGDGDPPTPADVMAAFRRVKTPHESQQVEKRTRTYDHSQGPMLYIAQKIVRSMEDAGYPAKIVEFFRTPERQAELLARRPPVTKAGPWQSAHQYYCAVDIVHPTKGWEVTETYWETLAACVRVVAHNLDVELDHGHYWNFRDSAHIQLANWRDFKALVGEQKPDWPDLKNLWAATLPKIALEQGIIAD